MSVMRLMEYAKTAPMITLHSGDDWKIHCVRVTRGDTIRWITKTLFKDKEFPHFYFLSKDIFGMYVYYTTEELIKAATYSEFYYMSLEMKIFLEVEKNV